MGRAKLERNNEIKRLFASGVTQGEIGKTYGITQCRVSAVVHDFRPCYRYCNYCNGRIDVRISGQVSICDDCRAKNAQEKIERIERRKAEREMKREAIRARWASMTRERGAINEQKQIQRLRARLVRAIARKLKIDKHEHSGAARKLAVYEWQTQGRESARLMVRMRDNFTCQDCGLIRTFEEVVDYNKQHGRGKMKSLDVHHTEGVCGKKSRGYDSTKDISRLITLCHSCHYKRHDFSKRITGEWKELVT